MDIISIAATGVAIFIVVFMFAVLIEHWRTVLLLLTLGICVFLITTYTVAVAVFVFIVISALNYTTSDSLIDALSKAAFYTVIIVLVGFAISGIIGQFGSFDTDKPLHYQ